MFESLEPGTWTEVGVAAGTLLLAVATVVLGWQARDQVKLAAEQAVAIQRPLVTPVVTPTWEWEGVRRVRIPLKNIGLGPAYNVTGGLYWTGGAGGASAILTAVVGPGEETTASVAGDGININWAAATGYLLYNDATGTEWQTHYRYRDVPDIGLTAEVVEVGRTSDLGPPLYSPEGRAPPGPKAPSET